MNLEKYAFVEIFPILGGRGSKFSSCFFVCNGLKSFNAYFDIL